MADSCEQGLGVQKREKGGQVRLPVMPVQRVGLGPSSSEDCLLRQKAWELGPAQGATGLAQATSMEMAVEGPWLRFKISLSQPLFPAGLGSRGGGWELRVKQEQGAQGCSPAGQAGQGASEFTSLLLSQGKAEPGPGGQGQAATHSRLPSGPSVSSAAVSRRSPRTLPSGVTTRPSTR